MKLQKVLWPKQGLCTEEKLYIHTNVIDEDFNINRDENRLKSNLNFINHSKVYLMSDGGFKLEKGGKATFDTYFNGFSIEKWKKYTQIKEVSLNLQLQGDFLVTLCSKVFLHGEVLRNEIIRREVHAKECGVYSFPFGNADKGMLYFEVMALSDESCLYSGYYEDKSIEKPVRQPKIGIDICTFKRERYIEKNIGLLNSYIFNNKNSQLCDNLEVFISDNGQTLDIDKLNSDKIHIVKNKNTGGAGGFTRGLMEIIKNGNPHGITHALVMDDDITIDPESIEKTYTVLSLLKDEYEDAFIGGAMLRIDKQNIQVESGASWNAGELVSNKQNLNMNVAWDCLFNEIEEYTEFNAWWYCCFPMSVVSEDNLPLPIFIRGDDLEYGLRNMKHLILMNGICVWHEPFENKYSSFLEYYIIRNRLIDNSFHFPNWGKKQLKKIVWKQWRSEVKRYRYKNVRLHTRGVKDYLKGVDFILNTDGEQLHKEIMAAGYKAVPMEQISVPFHYRDYEDSRNMGLSKWHNRIRKLTFNGWFLPSKHVRISSMAQSRLETIWRAKKIVYYDVTVNKAFECDKSWKEFFGTFFEVLGLTIQINRNYNKAKKDFIKRGNEIKNIEFWNRYLGLENKQR